jgi:hypothetical protein
MGTKGPPKGEGGAPPKEIDCTVVRRAAGIGCTNEEIATLVGVERTTLWRRLEKDPELQRCLDDGRNEGRATLRRWQWQKAEAGSDTMLIWLGKQLLQQRDKHELEAYGKDGAPLFGGIDRPPVITETAAEWLARRRAELAALESDDADKLH